MYGRYTTKSAALYTKADQDINMAHNCREEGYHSLLLYLARYTTVIVSGQRMQSEKARHVDI